MKTNVYYLALIKGLTTGIFLALTLATRSLLAADVKLTLGLASRIAGAAMSTGGIVSFFSYYTAFRRELLQMERQLNVSNRGLMSTGLLGRQILRDALLIGVVEGLNSFVGALIPLVTGALIPQAPWLAVAVSLVALAILGWILGRISLGHPLLWALGLCLTGCVLGAIGFELGIA